MQPSLRNQAAKLTIASGALTGSLSDIDLVGRVVRCLELGIAPEALEWLLAHGDDLTDLVKYNTH